MATLNPVAVVRDMSSSPNCTKYVHQIVGSITGGGTDVVTIETGLKAIISAIVINETDGAVVVPTVAASAVDGKTGTKKVSFTVANTKKFSYIITGLFDRSPTVDVTSGATTVTYEPRQGA